MAEIQVRRLWSIRIDNCQDSGDCITEEYSEGWEVEVGFNGTSWCKGASWRKQTEIKWEEKGSNFHIFDPFDHLPTKITITVFQEATSHSVVLYESLTKQQISYKHSFHQGIRHQGVFYKIWRAQTTFFHYEHSALRPVSNCQIKKIKIA